METLIKLTTEEKKSLCSILNQAKIFAKGDLARRIEQASQIYCKVKDRLKQITVTGDNITKLVNLLDDILAMENPLFENQAIELIQQISEKRWEK